MTLFRISFVALLCFALAILQVDAAFGQDETTSAYESAPLTDDTFATWRDSIRATESELAWQDLPWLTSFHEGLQQAAAENKPLLLWAMNGHPLGCT